MMIKNKKILVTGGAGFIGSHIVESLVAKGAEVTVFDNFSTGIIENIEHLKDSIEIIRGDILDYKSILAASKGVDIISHQAAQLEIFKCIDDPTRDLQTNTIGTLNVLGAAKENNVDILVNASSACVYGQAMQIPESENHPTNPNWAYGVSKLAAEKYCKIYQEQYGIPVVSLRYGIVYGEREWFGRVLTIFIKRILNNSPPVIFGDGNQIRDFIYVDDVVRMHNSCIEREKAKGAIFNVATGIGTTIKELSELVIRCSGKDISPLYENVPEGAFSELVSGRRRIPAELKNMVLDPAKAKKLTGWSAEISLEEGISRELGWASENIEMWNVGDEIHV